MEYSRIWIQHIKTTQTNLPTPPPPKKIDKNKQTNKQTNKHTIKKNKFNYRKKNVKEPSGFEPGTPYPSIRALTD